MEVFLSKDAAKQYNKLPKPERMKIKKRLAFLADFPFEGKKLSGEFDGLYTIRVWPYRVIYEINKKEKKIEVHKIAHRQGVYK